MILKNLLKYRKLNKDVYNYLNSFDNLTTNDFANIKFTKILKRYLDDEKEVYEYLHGLFSKINFDRHVDITKLIDDIVKLYHLTN